jgi:hypothetical protein
MTPADQAEPRPGGFKGPGEPSRLVRARPKDR